MLHQLQVIVCHAHFAVELQPMCDVLRRYTVTTSISVQMQAEVGAPDAFAVSMLGSLRLSGSGSLHASTGAK
jgi:hypothetical protein